MLFRSMPGMDAPGQDVTADQIIAGHRLIILRAHALGLRVIGGTLTPYGGATSPIRYPAGGERKRDAVNEWIRMSDAYVGAIDFDRAIRDPAHPASLAGL